MKHMEWPPSPDCNPLDYHCNKIKEKVYKNRLNKPFENELRKMFKKKFSLQKILQRSGKHLHNSLLAWNLFRKKSGECIKMQLDTLFSCIIALFFEINDF